MWRGGEDLQSRSHWHLPGLGLPGLCGDLSVVVGEGGEGGKRGKSSAVPPEEGGLGLYFRPPTQALRAQHS